MRKMFSENQIKNLAVQGVNEGIESGDIQVGSKLYMHNVLCDITNEDGDNDYSFILKILSKVSTPFTSLEQALEEAECFTCDCVNRF